MPKKVTVKNSKSKKKPKAKDKEKELDLKEKLKKRRNKKSFDEVHTRVTTYLEKSVREKMELLKDKGVIDSYTQLINLSIKHYIAKHLD
ncbi:hypothetical protein C7957_1403 [Halanaerobium saccharolyticum]|uniref:Uncharacterized protein n=1 Tax=Halanaerobium saccharolyticum TaxID=43595 RepID=A0A4R6RH86_9FIRM|nr:hypothetical protein [Halanaerobium saccharolyticum]TDP85634.1 hypothetical protein C7957_1403 [Halanaerobium saccharolyticum]